MSALDDWHRQRLSLSAKTLLREFQSVKNSVTRTDMQFERAFRLFVQALSDSQVQVLSNVLAELGRRSAIYDEQGQ